MKFTSVRVQIRGNQSSVKCTVVVFFFFKLWNKAQICALKQNKFALEFHFMI